MEPWSKTSIPRAGNQVSHELPIRRGSLVRCRPAALMAKSRKPRPKRGSKALASAADDLNYEWKMARMSGLALARAQRSGNVWATNMALETFLLHARVIRDFYGSSGSANDVLAVDFLGSSPRVRLPLLRSRATRVRLNRRIAHLSYSRSRLKRSWNVPTLLSEINQAMIDFIALLAKRDAKLAAIVSAP